MDGKLKELDMRFDRLEGSIEMTRLIVSEEGLEVTSEELEDYRQNIEGLIMDLRKLKRDVVKYYRKGE